MPDLVTPIAAFVLGAGLARANSCTVASAKRLVFEGKPDWLLGLWIAIGWAGLTMTAISLILPELVVLPAQLPVSWTVILGGLIMGLGATINRGCFLGSVSALGRGDLAYLFTLAGILAGLALIPLAYVPAGTQSSLGETPVLRAAQGWWLGAILFFPPVAYGIWRWWQSRRQPVLALMVVGIAGGTVYACNPDWSYSSGLFQIFAAQARPDIVLAQFAAIAVVAGVTISAIIGNRFQFRMPTAQSAAMRLFGGWMMAAGALLIPGGNDTLMLWAIPGLTLYGVVAYGVMIGTIAALLWTMQAWQARKRHLLANAN